MAQTDTTNKMVYYTLYIDWRKRPEDLRLRTPNDQESNYTIGKLGDEPMLFNNEGDARSDFHKLLWENEGLRQGQYFDTEKKTKVKKEKKIIVEKEVRIYKLYDDIEINKVYNEPAENTMARMPNHFTDMVITSPPYNVGDRSGIGEAMYDEYKDDRDEAEYEQWLFQIVDSLLRVTRKHIFFNIQMLGKNKLTVLELMGRYKKNIKDIIVWNKTVAPPHICPGVMNSKFEFIIILSNQNPHMKKFDDGNFKGNFNNVIEGRNASGNKYAKLNKATFPGYLPRTILNMFGDKKDLIYDPFSGTGTTQESCIIEGRNFIGSELSEKQHIITEERIKNEFSRPRFQF